MGSVIVHDETFDTRPGPFRWISVASPAEGELADVATRLGLSAAATDQLIRPHKTTRFTRLGSTGGVAAVRTVGQAQGNYSDARCGLVIVHDDGVIVTVDEFSGDDLPASIMKAVSDAGAVTGPASIVHGAIAAVLDQFADAESRLGDNLDALEDNLFSTSPPTSEEIYRLKRSTLRLRRGIAGIAAALDDRSDPVDANRIVRAHYLHEQFDAYDSALTDILTTHLAEVSVRQNSDMRTMSAWAAILVLPTVLTGIYGMNFTHMPELTWTFGYPLCIAVMVAVCAGLYVQFRRIHWL